MKKAIFSLFVIFSFGKILAQRNTAIPTTSDNIGIQVPINISNKFNSDYPNMHTAWAMEGKNYRADYTEGTLDRSVTYDRDANFISRSEELAKNNYPRAIGDYYLKNYPNEQFSVWSLVDKTGNKRFYIHRNSETLWFDNNGKYKQRSAMYATHRQEPRNY